MALSALVVRIGADLSDLNRGLGRADRDVDQFGKKVRPLARSMTRLGMSANMAGSSLSRMGGVLPGVFGGTGKMVAALGTAGIALGETAILSAGLTKAYRLLTVASAAVAASSAPVWLAALATPAGLALAAVVALTGAVVGLRMAWKKLTATAAMPFKAFEMIDLSGRVMDKGKMTGRLAHEMEGVAASAAALGNAGIEITLARNAVNAWGDAVEGIRPVTDALVERWRFARDMIVSALKDTSRFTADATTELYRMLAALKAVAAVSAPMSTSEAAGKIRTDIGATNRNLLGRGLNPRDFLGNRMDFRPTPMKGSGFFGDVMSGIRPKDPQGNAMSLGQTVGATLGGAGGGMVAAFASFGPMAAILPVINSALETLEPVITALMEPLREIGRLVGEILGPPLKLVADILAVSLAPTMARLAAIASVVTVAFSYVSEAIGWLIKGIGKLVDKIPGVSAKGVIRMGQEMIDSAKAARRNADATDAATDAVNEFASALSNIPRVLNVNALRHLITGGAGGGGGGGSGGPPVSNPNRPGLTARAPIGNITINVYGATDPIATSNAIGRELDRRFSRGGTNRLGMRFA